MSADRQRDTDGSDAAALRQPSWFVGRALTTQNGGRASASGTGTASCPHMGLWVPLMFWDVKVNERIDSEGAEKLSFFPHPYSPHSFSQHFLCIY